MKNGPEICSIREMFAFSAGHIDDLHSIIIVKGLQGATDVLDVVRSQGVVTMLTV
jgi:hypothetical protein